MLATAQSPSAIGSSSAPATDGQNDAEPKDISIRPNAIAASHSDEPMQVASAVRAATYRRQIAHQASWISAYVTLSIGVCTLVPDSRKTACEILVRGADEALYTL